jgi:hypothetical protein
VRARRPAC